MSPVGSPVKRLQWQSQMVLLLVLPAAAVWTVILVLQAESRVQALTAIAFGVGVAGLVRKARAATTGGACTGGLLMACFCLTTPGWRSCGWAVLVMLVLTLAATRFSSSARQGRLAADDAREQKHGRGAPQVAANLGVAALAGTLTNVHGLQVALTVMLAALAEAAADTLASELGQAFGGEARLITTLRRVEAGTDGGVTLAGTVVGAAGALAVAAVGVFAVGLPLWSLWIAAAAGISGLLFDSLLGAILERAGWLNNDAVNLLSTLFAGLVALGVAEVAR